MDKLIGKSVPELLSHAQVSTAELIRRAKQDRYRAAGLEEFRFIGSQSTIGDFACERIGDSVWLSIENAKIIAGHSTGARILPNDLFESVGFTDSEKRLNASGLHGKTDSFLEKLNKATELMTSWLRGDTAPTPEASNDVATELFTESVASPIHGDADAV